MDDEIMKINVQDKGEISDSEENLENLNESKTNVKGGKKIMAKNEYPMTYEEYEKRVIELFLERFDEKDREKALKRVNELLEADPDFISGLYGDTCFRYDRPDIYGENCKRAFDDYLLNSIPVNTLDMFLGGELD